MGYPAPRGLNCNDRFYGQFGLSFSKRKRRGRLLIAICQFLALLMIVIKFNYISTLRFIIAIEHNYDPVEIRSRGIK